MKSESKGQSMAMILVVILIVIIAAVGIYYVTSEGGEEEEVKNPGTLTVQRIAEPETLDPAWAYDTASSEVMYNVYEPLIFFEGTKTDEYVPRVASEWEISEDGETYRFKIKDDLEFHTGNSLTPEDVEYSFERVMIYDRDGGPSWMLLEPLLGVHGTRNRDGEIKVDFSEIDDSVEVDGDWVQFNLKNAYPPFMGILCQSWSSIIDKEWAIEQGAWPGTEETWKDYNNPDEPVLNDSMSGTGPFKLDRWSKGDQVVLSRFDDYWREPADLEHVRFQNVGEWSTRKSTFLQGDADIIDVPRAHASEVENEEGIVKHEDLLALETNPVAFFTYEISEDSGYIGSGELDGNGIPPDFFSDRQVRLGFTKAFDFPTYIEDAFLGQAKKAPGPIPTAMKFFNEDQETFSYDPEAAEEHFKRAYGGSVDDPGPVWEEGFEMTITYNADATERRVAAQLWEEELEAMNDDFQIDVEERKWDVYLGEMVSKKLPIFIIGWAPDFPDPHNFVTPFMHSTGTFSAWQGYGRPEVDDLIDAGISSTDEDERRQIYYDLQEIYHEDVPSFPLCEPQPQRFHRSWVEGWYHNPMYPTAIYAYELSK